MRAKFEFAFLYKALRNVSLSRLKEDSVESWNFGYFRNLCTPNIVQPKSRGVYIELCCLFWFGIYLLVTDPVFHYSHQFTVETSSLV